MRVLIVEDHAKLAMGVATILRREGMAVDIAFNGGDALTQAAAIDYDVVVLDRDLPGVHGDEVCRTLVANGSESRVLMLTAAGAVSERVQGLSLGADDYLPKPFAAVELVARIRALARRSRSLPPTLTHDDLELDTRNDSSPDAESRSRSDLRSSPSSSCCSAPKAVSSRPSRFSNTSGTTRPIRSRQPFG